MTGYLVFYTTDPKQDLREWVVDGVLEGDELSATIKRLTLSTTYYFKVQARNSKGYGPLSETVIYKTPQGKISVCTEGLKTIGFPIDREQLENMKG